MNMPRPIRILYLHNPYFMGGGEMSFLNLLAALDRSRFEPYFLSAPFKPFLDELASLEVPFDTCEFPPLRPNRLGAVGRSIRAIREAAEGWDVHLLHGNAPRANLLAGLAARGRSLKVVYHTRNLLLEGDYIDLDYWSSRLADAIICNSRTTESRFRHRWPFRPRTFVIFNGVDLETFRPGLDKSSCRESVGLPEGSLVVGTVGRLHPTKGQDTFIRAAHRVVQHREDVHFVIAGEDISAGRTWEAHLKALAQSLGLAERVHFTGFRRDVPRVMGAMDCFVLASDVDPIPRGTQEAMACGLPVVATLSGGNVELIEEGETGYLVPVKDADAMARRLMELLADSSLRDKVGLAARKWAETHFSRQVHAQKVTECYEALLAGR